jgi:uncharacterized protein YdbL (DUF1318 family)
LAAQWRTKHAKAKLSIGDTYMKNRFIFALFAASSMLATAALAVDNNGPIDTAMSAGLVGEQADGYLGFVRTPSAAQTDLQRRVNEVNIRRRGVYIQVARDSGETLDRVALLQALRQIVKAPAGEYFQDITNTWCAKGPNSDVRQAADNTIVIRCTAAPAATGK